MTHYIPSFAAESLSNALWSLSRPPSLRQPEDTYYLFGWVDDLKGSRWLVVDTEYEINIHPDAELGGIAKILQPFIDAKQLPADTLDNLTALIEANRGKRLVVYDAFPQLFKSMSKTYEQMNDAGLLAEPEMP